MIMKRKINYIVTIIADKYKQEFQVIAYNRKEAEDIVDNVLLECSCFNFQNKNQYRLEIRKKKRKE